MGYCHDIYGRKAAGFATADRQTDRQPLSIELSTIKIEAQYSFLK